MVPILTVLSFLIMRHTDGVVKQLQSIGVLLHFLPPYCPEAFSKANKATKLLEDFILSAFLSITPHDCCQRSGYLF